MNTYSGGEGPRDSYLVGKRVGLGKYDPIQRYSSEVAQVLIMKPTGGAHRRCGVVTLLWSPTCCLSWLLLGATFFDHRSKT